MFAFLRIIRGICGFFFAMQILQLVEAATWLAKPEAAGVDMGKFLALVIVKVVVLVIAGGLFFWLRGLINKLHTKKSGVPHPALAEKRWAL